MEKNKAMNNLTEYLGQKLARVKDDYKWRKMNYKQTVEFKNKIIREWNNSDSIQKESVAKKIVEWGGIYTNRNETIRRYVNWALNRRIELPLLGISSSSKIFSIAYPEECVIYDARVAAALLAI